MLRKINKFDIKHYHFDVFKLQKNHVSRHIFIFLIRNIRTEALACRAGGQARGDGVSPARGEARHDDGEAQRAVRGRGGVEEAAVGGENADPVALHRGGAGGDGQVGRLFL